MAEEGIKITFDEADEEMNTMRLTIAAIDIVIILLAVVAGVAGAAFLIYIYIAR